MDPLFLVILVGIVSYTVIKVVTIFKNKDK
jgi:hypothetical protein